MSTLPDIEAYEAVARHSESISANVGEYPPIIDAGIRRIIWSDWQTSVSHQNPGYPNPTLQHTKLPLDFRAMGQFRRR